jgi:hypothetical protein
MAFLIIEVAYFECCRIKLFIAAMENFGLQWSFLYSIQLKTILSCDLTKSQKKKLLYFRLSGWVHNSEYLRFFNGK